jgi:protein HOOK3
LEKVEEVPATLSVTDSNLPQKLTNDFQLAFEEEHASLQHEHEALKKKHADFITRFEHLQAKHDDLHEHNNRIEEQLRILQESNIGDPTEYFRDLRKQIEERDELIATHEHEAEVNRITRERQTRELASLRPSAQRLTELEDEVKVLKTDNASLTKKANMVDHFQKKLEMQIVTEKENSNLRQKVDVLQGNQQAFDKVYEENDALRTTIGEYKKRFQTYENEVMTLTTQKATLQAENRYSLERIDALTASKQHDEEFIKTLQEQINTSDQPLSAPKSPSGRTATLTLEEELEQSDDPTPNYLLEISRLKAENQLLKSNTAGTTNAMLRIDLEESERIRNRLTENLQELTEKHAIGQEQLRAIISTSSGEKLVQNIDVALNIGPFRILTEGFYRDDAVIHTRKLYLETNRELSEVKSKLAELEATLSSRDRELLSSQADCKPSCHTPLCSPETNLRIVAAVDRDELDALEDLKATNEIITSSLQNDLLLLQSRHKNLLTDHEQQKSHLVGALLEKDKLRQELAVSKEAKDSDSNDFHHEIDAQGGDETTKTALQALKEVRDEKDSPTEISPRRVKFWQRPSRLSFRPYTPRPEPLQRVSQSDEAALLALEREAIGAVKKPVLSDIVIARQVPLPPSPLTTNSAPKQLFRLRHWTFDKWKSATIVTNDIYSNPKTKKGSYKTSIDGSRWPRRAE